MTAPFPKRAVRDRFQQLNTETTHEAMALAARGKHATLWGLVVSPFLTFVRVYAGRGGWRQGMSGFIDAMFASYETFIRSAKLWELHHTASKTPPP